MKILRTTDTVLVNSAGKVLKVRPDTYVEPLPNAFMIEIEVEKDQVFTLPTGDPTAAYIDLFLNLYTTYNGASIASNDNSGSNSQPLLAQVCAANTEYYIKITGTLNNKEGIFGIQVTGPDVTGVPTTETGITSLTVGTPVNGQYLSFGGEIWFKFKTGTAGTYTMRTNQGILGNYNYSVDWGDGTLAEGVTTYNSASRIHTYTSAGTYVITITGTMPVWSVNNDNAIRLSITKCISWGAVGLRKIDFYGCTAMTNLPDQTSKLATVVAPYSFINFCRDCTSLVSIPYGTFWGTSEIPVLQTRSFSYAFYNCTSLRTLHSELFRDVENTVDFSYAFMGCYKLVTLPSQLFKKCYKVTTFARIFENCSLLNNLPADTFYREMIDINYSLVAQSDMTASFFNCDALTTLPSGFFSSPQIDNLGLNMVKATNLTACFGGCALLNNLPAYLFHNQVYCTIATGVLSQCPELTAIPESCMEGCTLLNSVGSYSYEFSQYYYGLAGYSAKLVSVGANCFKDCPALTNLSYLFVSCSSLTTLPDYLFDSCINANTFYSAFSSTKLATLNPDLFKYNTKVADFSYCFSQVSLLTAIPETLFWNCTASPTLSFAGTFRYCPLVTVLPPKLFRYNSNATSFNETFAQDTGITRIPVINENAIDYGFFYFNPQVTTFYGTFNNCRLANVTSPSFIPAIPEITFLNNTQVTDFSYTFQGNIALQSIPALLFSECRSASNFTYTFAGCSHVEFTSIPANLLANNQNATNFTCMFNGVKLTSIPSTLFSACSKATTFYGTFSGTNITAVPAGLFDVPGASAQEFSYCFQSCNFLVSLPNDMFRYNINALNFSYIFAYCPLLATVTDSNMFRYCVIASNFTGVFYNCYALASVPALLFQNNRQAINYTGTFYGCNKLKQNRNIFYADNEKATAFLNRTVNFNSCFYRGGFSALDLYMGYASTYNGAIQQNDNDSGGNYQPQITRSLLANTNYYIKITINGTVDAGAFDILVTGGTGPGTPDAEAGCTLLAIGTTLTGETISGAEVKWYKFKTTTAGNYVFKTIQNAAEITARQGEAPDLWNCTFTFTPTKTSCWATAAGNNAISLNNFASIPAEWK
jgi:hypothetical protein